MESVNCRKNRHSPKKKGLHWTCLIVKDMKIHLTVITEMLLFFPTTVLSQHHKRLLKLGMFWASQFRAKNLLPALLCALNFAYLQKKINCLGPAIHLMWYFN